MLGDVTLSFPPIHRWGRGKDWLEGVSKLVEEVESFEWFADQDILQPKAEDLANP